MAENKPDLAAAPGGYPVILNGDHAVFEAEWAGKDPKTRPDWPLPSFDARDWAEAFCKVAKAHGQEIDEAWMVTWFANALMRGFDERAARAAPAAETAPDAGLVEALNSILRLRPAGDCASYDKTFNIIAGLPEQQEIAALTVERDRLHRAAETARDALGPFPMQDGPPIPRCTAEIIYEVYAAMFGRTQTLDRLAERGGFGWGEIKHIFEEARKYKPEARKAALTRRPEALAALSAALKS